MSEDADVIKWSRTSPVAVVFFLFKAGKQFLNHGLPAMAVIVATYASASSFQKSTFLAGLAVVLLVGIVGAVLSWLRFRYRIVDERVLVRSGVFHRDELSVEFNRVQNIGIREPFYTRPFGLALFSIDTAGSGDKEIVLGGIDKSAAIALREVILSRANADPETGIEKEEDQATDQLLLSRSGKDIAIYGLTINFIIWLAIAMGAIFGAYDVSEDVIYWVARKIQIQDLLAMAPGSNDVYQYAWMILGTTLAIFILLPMISVIGALFKHYGYELMAEGETYRKTSGLLSRQDESLKRHKIQAVVLRQNFVARLFKRSNMQLRVASAGSGLEQGQLPIGSRSIFLVPALHPPEVNKLTAEFLPGSKLEKAEFSRVKLSKLVKFYLGLLVFPISLSPSITLSVIFGWKFLLLPPMLVAIGYLVVRQCWRKIGYSVVGEYGVIRSGFIGTRTTIFPLFKLQKVEIRQTPGQRRADLAHLTIHLASHSLSLPYVRVDHARQFRDLALFYAESSDRAWY